MPKPPLSRSSHLPDRPPRRSAEQVVTRRASLGQVESITEGGGGPSPRFALAAVRFEPGETAVEQQLTVTFELL